MKNIISIFTAVIMAVSIASAQTLSANGSTRIEANGEGNLGILYPLVDGRASTQQEREQFVYRIRTNAQFIPLDDVVKFVNSYDETSPETQYGFWNEANSAGIWLRPVTEDCRLQIYLGSHFVEYELVGNPNAPRPNPNTPGDKIAVGTPDNPELAGWDLDWNDEFNGNSLDRSKWNIDIGVGNNGWGNNERQYYEDKPENLYVTDGKLHFKSSKQNRTTNGWDSYFNSGKVTSAGKYFWKYGRIDFFVKLPLGQGYWPALWMMPQYGVYGGWALSGEIDVMEAKGRFPDGSSGALHFGDAWPRNTYIHGSQSFTGGRTIADFNVYTLVWEENKFSWYVNGNRFFSATNDRWRTAAAPNNPLAPFDQEFFIIMNLAIGGNFDGGRVPGDAELGRTMEIDYVRVYKPATPKDTISIPGTFNSHKFSKKSSEIAANNDDNGQYVGNLVNNSFLEYTIKVSKAWKYNISLEAATVNNTETERRISAAIGETALGEISVPTAEGWFNFSKNEIIVDLDEGIHKLRFTANGAVNIRDIEITEVMQEPEVVINKLAKRNISPAFAGISNGQINLTLQAGNYTAELYDLQGRMIARKNIRAADGVNVSGLKTGNLSKGVLILNVKRRNVSVIRQKIVIKQ